MSKPTKSKKGRVPAAARPAPAAVPFSPEAQELRALLRRVPDGFQATLNALAGKAPEARERVLTELARGLGKEILPLVRAAALGKDGGLACSAVRVLPVFGTRAAADALVEAYEIDPEGDRGTLALQSGAALRARGITVSLPEPPHEEGNSLRLTLRETSVSAPDGVGSRSVVARLQDQYGVWHAILILCNDQAGVKDGFLRPMSRHEWTEHLQRVEERGTSQAVCPPDFARWQVEQARALNAQTGFPLGESLKDWDAHLGPPPEEYQPPPPPDPGDDLAAQAGEGATLFKQPDIARWFLETADCVPYARRWSDVATRIRYRGESDALRAEQQEILSSVLRDLVDETLRTRYQARLEDAARVYEWRGQAQPARRAAAVAALLAEGIPLDESPFFLELARRSLWATEALLLRGEDLERQRYKPLKRYQS
jgi:hypothetical protein